MPAHLLCRSQKTLPVTALLTPRSSESTSRKHLLSNKRGNSRPKELTGMVRVVNVCAGGGTGSAEHLGCLICPCSTAQPEDSQMAATNTLLCKHPAPRRVNRPPRAPGGSLTASVCCSSGIQGPGLWPLFLLWAPWQQGHPSWFFSVCVNRAGGPMWFEYSQGSALLPSQKQTHHKGSL